MPGHLTRFAERLCQHLTGLDPDLRVGARGRLFFHRRRLATVRVRPRKHAVRVDLAPGWPWPLRRMMLRSAHGWVIWVDDERTLRRAVALFRRTVWRERRRRSAECRTAS